MNDKINLMNRALGIESTQYEKNDKPLWWNQMDKKDSESNYSKLPVLKLVDGESVEIEFLSNGKEWHDKENDKDNIIFEVMANGEKKAWFVNKAFWSLLKSIRDMQYPLLGKRGILRRRGEKKETLYFLEPIQE